MHVLDTKAGIESVQLANIAFVKAQSNTERVHNLKLSLICNLDRLLLDF